MRWPQTSVLINCRVIASRERSGPLVSDRAGTVTWRDLWTQAERACGGRAQGRWLCEVASGLDHQEFLDHLDSPAHHRMVVHFDSMLTRLSHGEPLQYVLGQWSFRRLDLMVDGRVLIPRPETEGLVDLALTLLNGRIAPIICADLGCGSGAIGLSLALELVQQRTIWMTDISADAVDVARANTAGIGRCAANVRLAVGSWFQALPDDLCGSLDMVCCNPPYIAVDDPQVESIVRDWEPNDALFAGPDGLDHVRTIIDSAARWLAPGGWLVMEFGTSQADSIVRLATHAGLEAIAVHADAAGHDRILVARRSTAV